VLSSRIEGIQASLAEVLEYEADAEASTLPQERRDDIREVQNYRQAMRQAQELLVTLPLSLRVIKHLHATLLAGVHGDNKGPGEFRKIPTWIGPRGCTIEDALFANKDSFVERLLAISRDGDWIFSTPTFRATDFEKHAGFPVPTAKRILRCLENAEILAVIREASGRRPRVLCLEQLLAVAEGRPCPLACGSCNPARDALDDKVNQVFASKCVRKDLVRAWLEQTRGAELGLARLATGLSATETRKLIAGLKVNGLVDLLGEDSSARQGGGTTRFLHRYGHFRTPKDRAPTTCPGPWPPAPPAARPIA
jgi:hypothetical protein